MLKNVHLSLSQFKSHLFMESSPGFFMKFYINISICKLTVPDTGVMKNKDARERNQSFCGNFFLINYHPSYN